MRILIVTGQLPNMGFPTLGRPGRMAPVLRQIESLRSIGISVDVLEIKGTTKGFKYLSCLPRVWALARKADLVHAHYGFCGWVARSQLRKPVIVSFMGSDLLGGKSANGQVKARNKLEVRTNRLLARLVGAVIVKSAEMAEVVSPTRAHIIPNGVDLHAFCPVSSHESRALLGWTEKKHYVLFPGDPDTPVKGFTLAQAVVKVASERLADPLELVPLCGVAPDQVPLYMNGSHVLLMTSFSEGSPNVIKEAMSCNLPIVSVPVGDVPELLAGVEGCAICPREVEALAKALVIVLNSAQRTNGREILKNKELDLENVARRILNIYEEVLTRKRRLALRVRELNP